MELKAAAHMWRIMKVLHPANLSLGFGAADCAGNSNVCDESGCQPQLLQLPATQSGHYLREAGGLLPAANSTANTSADGNSVADHAAVPLAPQTPGPANAIDGGSNSGSGGGVPAEPELYVSWMADGGLINQAMSHIGGVAAAIAVGANGVVT